MDTEMRLVRLTLDCGVHYIMIVSSYPLNYLTFEESDRSNPSIDYAKN